MAEQAIYYDSSLCTACKGCQVACKCWNNLPSPTELNANQFTGTYQNPPDLNENTRIIMVIISTMYPLSTRPESMAEDAVVAPPWASGSQRWKGNMALLMPSPPMISPTATVSGIR